MKNDAEHGCVVDFVATKLKDISSSVDEEAKHLLKMKHVTHLRKAFHCVLDAAKQNKLMTVSSLKHLHRYAHFPFAITCSA